MNGDRRKKAWLELIFPPSARKFCALVAIVVIGSCVGGVKPYRVVLNELPQHQRVGLLDPVMTTDPVGIVAKYSDARLVAQSLRTQWDEAAAKMIARWQQKGVEVKRITAVIKKVPAVEDRAVDTDHRKGQKYAYDVREMQRLARSHAVDLLVIPIYQFSNVASGSLYLSYNSHCEGIPYSITRLWYLVVRANGDIVAASPDFSVPMFYSVTMNYAENAGSFRCRSFPARSLDLRFVLDQVITIEDAIR